MLHNVNKKRLQQAIDAYNEADAYRTKHGFGGKEYHDLWTVFYHRACYCIDGLHNNNIPSLIYNTDIKYRTVERLYYAILTLGYNDSESDYYAVIGEEYYA